ncbi:MAG: esterase/lipase family protein [Dermatophilaceae bacterium]
MTDEASRPGDAGDPPTQDMGSADVDGVLAPTVWMARREWRAALEYAASAVRARKLDDWPLGDGHPVLVLPGFLAGPESTVFLRQHLRKLGYRSHDWRHGRNLGLREGMPEQLRELLLELHDRYGRRVSLVGWSAGGVYAREMARALPEHTRCVVTLGSPFRGHPASTRAWATYRLLNRGAFTEELFSDEARARRAEPLPVPTTCVYSRSDGIVAWQCCVSEPAPRTENVEVHGSHLGYGHHLDTLRVIADRLAQPEGAWQPYADRTHAGPSQDPRAEWASAHPAEPAVPPPTRSAVPGLGFLRRRTAMDGTSSAGDRAG